MRRTLTLLLVAVAVAGGAPGVAQQPVAAPGPCQRAEERVPGAPLNVELVTVSDSSFTVTWLTCDAEGSPLPSDTTVSYGSSPNPLSWTTVRLEEEVAFHHAEVEGLEAGRTYFYQVSSDGLPGRYDRYHPGSFTTLTPPPGRLLFSFAVLADVHIGEDTSGLATSTPFPFPPGYSAEDYAEAMATAAVQEINARGIALTVLSADNTSHAKLREVLDAKAILDGLVGPYLVARGAHDRPSEPAAVCRPDGDCFREVFFPRRKPGHIFYGERFGGYDVIALDSVDLATGTGEISDQQLAWLEQRLERGRADGRPAVIFFHHPVSEWSTTLAIPPAVFGVNQQDAQEFLRTIAPYDVRLVINAHTHRNWISYSPWTGRMPILEVGPSKEYPGGYSMIRVYEGGFLRTFHRLGCGFCRRWIETTRWQYLGQYPHYTTGSLRDRNFVHRFDRPDVPGVPSLPFNPWPPGAPMEA
ncbi:MAG TPA: metallophosphoesterase family protein [Actinomycetota bacterium]|nr:metallophosphoesterase family protein [Actinomycetota bacterium]